MVYKNFKADNTHISKDLKKKKKRLALRPLQNH